MEWSLYQNGKFLPPLKFSNGKTQEDVVKEVLEEIEKGEKVIFIKGICGTGKCLEGNSLVFCKPNNEKYFSYHKIRDIVGKSGKIISLDKKGDFVEGDFINARKTGTKKLFILKTRTGREIISSSNHPFLTITKKGIEWKRLKEINNDSYICLPNKIEISEKEDYNENEVKILAHLIAEGKLGDKAGSPTYYQCPKQNPIVRRDYINSLKNLFPEGKIKEQGKQITIKFGIKDTTKGTTNKLRLFIRRYGLEGKKSSEKLVPNFIFGIDKNGLSIFLSRLFSCDGSIYKRSSNQIVIEYCSISKRLIYDISILLQKFGIQHTITSKKFRDNKNYSFKISISDNKNLKKYIDSIGFIGRKQKIALSILPHLKNHKFTSIDKVPRITREYIKSLGYNYTEIDRFLNYKEIERLRKNIGFKKIRADKSINTPFVFNQQKIDFLREHIKKVNGQIKDETLSFICSESILWDKIRSIEDMGENKTYDLEVPKHHNFISNGIVVHNSAIALNIAKEIGKTSIVVPGKNLQAQYKNDYEENKYVLKKNNEKLKISVITGRKNHRCKFLEENSTIIPKIKREIDSKLHDIFEGRSEYKKETDLSADNQNIPCKIEIKEKNWNKMKEYLKKNKDVNYRNFLDIKDVKRVSVAGVCPYWCPVLPEKYELGGTSFVNATKRTYRGLERTNYIFYQRRAGCPFYEQFNSYIDSDVVVFNSMKYILESALNRKPETEIEIVDECDEFLDKFSNQRNINLERLQNSLMSIFAHEEETGKIIRELNEIISQIKKNSRINDAVLSGEIIPLKETGIYDLLNVFLKNKEFIEEVDDESYVFDVEEIARMFEDFLGESYVTVSKRENNLIASVVTTNLAKRFKELLDKNKVFVLMSGTIHSENVLKNIFGLKNFKIIDAETESQGRIEVQKTGLEKDCKYSNFSNGKFNRRDYLKSLDKCIEVSKKPTLVHVNAFLDLPSEDEIEKFKLKNLINREKLKDIQDKDNTGKLVEEFKKGKIKVLFSTRSGRGIDFPGVQCNSIVFTKYPNPNVKDAFWKILYKTKPMYYWDFYKDKARREFWQKIYRGLRFKEDHIYLLSPDCRVLDVIEDKKV